MGKQEDIKRTYDYAIFKRMAGNRAISESNVKKIMRSIQRYGWWGEVVLVNEKMEVADGQHRIEALKRMGMPVEYRVVEGITIDDIVAINNAVHKWTVTDAIASYAERGKVDYVRINNLINEFPSMTRNCIYAAAHGLSDGAIKRGTATCSIADYEAARESLSFASKLQPIIGNAIGKKGKLEYYSQALIYCHDMPCVDNKILEARVRSNSAMLILVGSTDQALGQIEKIYNYRTKIKVNILLEYKAYISEVSYAKIAKTMRKTRAITKGKWVM